MKSPRKTEILAGKRPKELSALAAQVQEDLPETKNKDKKRKRIRNHVMAPNAQMAVNPP